MKFRRLRKSELSSFSIKHPILSRLSLVLVWVLSPLLVLAESYNIYIQEELTYKESLRYTVGVYKENFVKSICFVFLPVKD